MNKIFFSLWKNCVLFKIEKVSERSQNEQNWCTRRSVKSKNPHGIWNIKILLWYFTLKLIFVSENVFHRYIYARAFYLTFCVKRSLLLYNIKVYNARGSEVRSMDGEKIDISPYSEVATAYSSKVNQHHDQQQLQLSICVHCSYAFSHLELELEPSIPMYLITNIYISIYNYISNTPLTKYMQMTAESLCQLNLLFNEKLLFNKHIDITI